MVLSHLHSDHVSGLKLVKDAKKILVSNIEWNDALQINNPHLKSMWEGVKIETFQFQPSSYGAEKLAVAFSISSFVHKNKKSKYLLVC